MREVIRELAPLDRVRVLARSLADWIDALELAREDSEGKVAEHLDTTHGLGEDMLWELRAAFGLLGE